MVIGDPTHQSPILASRETLERIKGWLLFAGVVAVLLGIVAVAMPNAAAIGTGVAMGTVGVIGGAIQLLRAIPARGTPDMKRRLLTGGLFTAAGVAFLVWPRPSVALFALGLGAAALWLLAWRAFRRHQDGEPGWWLPGLGAVGLLIVVIVVTVAGWPSSLVWAAGTVGGFALAGIGWWLIMIGTAHDSQRSRGLAGRWPPR